MDKLDISLYVAYGLGLVAIAIALTTTAYIFDELSRPSPSRRPLNPAGKTIEYKLPPDFEKMLNISPRDTFEHEIITYETKDGRIVSKEYNPYESNETIINWNKENYLVEKSK